MDSYDIIAKAVRDYVINQMKDDRCIDNDYIVHFYQKYSWSDKWEECTVIISGQDLPNGAIEFSNDFCEGQTDVRDITVLALYEVGTGLCYQALSFLQNLMIKQGETKHQMPEYFEDDFYTLIKNYPLLDVHLLMNYNEGRRRLENVET